MPICRYFIQGRCQKGAQCEFEHSGEAAQRGDSGGSPRGRGRGRGRGGRGGAFGDSPRPEATFQQPFGGGASQPPAYNHHGGPPRQPQKAAAPNINPEDVIRHDLVDVHIEWPLGCYGLNLSWESGDNVIHGDYSPEELRCEAYAQSRTLGNIDVYRATLAQVMQEQQRQIRDVVENPARGVALGRTPRAVRIQHLAASKQGLSAPTTAAASGSAASISSLPSQPLPSQSLGGQPNAHSRSADTEAFNFGSIPELPPS